MKNNKYILLIITLVMNLSYGQINVSSSNNDGILSNTRNLVLTPVGESSSKIVGSRYINNEFIPSYINDNKTLYMLRYDAFNDEIEIKKENGIFLIPKDYSFFIDFSDTKTKYKVYSFMEKKNKDGFFKIIKGLSKISLLVKEKIKYYEEVKAESGFEKSKPASYKRIKDKYFIGFNETHIAKEIPKKTKDFLKLFDIKNQEIEKYIKSNKIKLKNEKDLINLIEYLNTIF